MSGRKRALLRLKDRDKKKLQEIGSRLSDVEQDFSSLKSRIEEFREQTRKNFIKELDNRDIVLENCISDLDWRLQEIEEATQINLEKQFRDQAVIVRSSQEKMLEIQNNSTIEVNLIEDLLGQYIQEVSGQLDSVFYEVSDINSNQQNLHQSASQTLIYAERILDNLKKYSEGIRFLANEFEFVKQELFMGWQNFNYGAYQAALLSAQQAILTLVQIRYSVEEHNHQVFEVKNDGLERVTRILDLAEKSLKVKALDLEGNDLDFLINVDYWTGGQISRAINILRSLQNELLNKTMLPDLSVLNEIVYQTLPEWENAIRDYVSLARLEVIASQTRYEVAKTVVDALSLQGFELETGSFESSDMRSPYHIILGNFEGSEVHISISTNGENPFHYILDIDSNDEEIRTEHELRHRANELLETIKESGIIVDQVYQDKSQKSKMVGEFTPRSYSVSSKLR